MEYFDLKKNNTICLIGSAKLDGETSDYMEDESKDKMYVGHAAYNIFYRNEDMLLRSETSYLIDIHTIHTRKPKYIEWLSDYPLNILMQRKVNEISNSIEFPLDAIKTIYKRSYFMSSFAYMVAWAMLMKYKRIELYGVTMIYDDDLIQRYNFEYWLGRAEQAGIEIATTEQCDLLKCSDYGYNVDNTLGVYIQKYLHNLRKQTTENISNAIELLERAKISNELATKEAVKFNKEILNRHKLNIIPIDYEE